MGPPTEDTFRRLCRLFTYFSNIHRYLVIFSQQCRSNQPLYILFLVFSIVFCYIYQLQCSSNKYNFFGCKCETLLDFCLTWQFFTHFPKIGGSGSVMVRTWLIHRQTQCHSYHLQCDKKAQLTQRERATAVHVWRPTANKCKIRKNLYFSAQGHSRSLLSVSIETRVWLPISD